MSEPLQKPSYLGLIFILGLLSMLMPLSIDMYVPSLPAIGQDFGVSDGAVQLTISAYLISFAVGQIFYGPLSDAFGRKPILLAGLAIFVIAALCCVFSGTIGEFILARLLNGIAAAAVSVVINALMRDMFNQAEFSRMMSLVTLIMTLAPLLAPILGGFVIVWFSWHMIFVVLAFAAFVGLLLVTCFIKETLPHERRQPLVIGRILRNFVTLFRHKKVMCYMLASAFSAAGMFSFLSVGPFVYINLHHIAADHFGYYSAVNIVFLFIMTSINSRFVQAKGILVMFKLGVTVQFIFGLWLVVSSFFGFGFWALVLGVAGYVGCISMVSSNGMAMVLENYPYIAGTAASLIGTFRFGLSAVVGSLVALFSSNTATSSSTSSSQPEWLMVGTMFLCVLLSMLLFLYSLKTPLKKSD